MNLEFIAALNDLEKERGISKDVLIEAIEDALCSAYKKNYSNINNVRVSMDKDTGEFEIYVQKTVVEEVTDDENQISLDHARLLHTDIELGDIYEQPVPAGNFGRIAAQSAKNVVVQRIREAERGAMLNEYSDKIGEVISGVVQRADDEVVVVRVGKSDAILPLKERMAGEKYYVNYRMKVYVTNVRATNRGLQITVSRSHPNLVKRFFEMEVPEIRDGVVEIVGIARDAGYRTKMAVMSRNPNVEPLGTCVGPRGSRVNYVVNELCGEKIDIINYSSDPATYIANALSPARAMSVRLDEEAHIANVVVEDQQLSLAIGKEGQNARLAAKLTGWKIDIKSRSQALDMLDGDYDGEDA